MFKNIIVASAIGLSMFFSGCGEDTAEANSYDIELGLDKGDYDKVIKELKDCNQYSGDEKEKCYLNLGAAYFGKANFDMISMAQEIADVDDTLNDDNKSKEFNKIVFKKLDDENLKTGINWYKKVVDSTKCNDIDYKKLTTKEKSACIAINPLLLSKLIDDKNTTETNTTVSLEDIIEFKDVLKNAVPELQSEDLVTIISGDTLTSDKDANGNNILDSVEATDIVLKKANSGTANGNIKDTQINVYTHAKLTDVDYYKVNFGGTSKDYYRLTQTVANSAPIIHTILTTIPNKVCDVNNTEISGTINGTTILPCVKLKEDGNVTSLNDSVVTILNSGNLLDSIALASESEDNTKTDEQKIKDFKDDICDTSSGNPNGCTIDGNGKVTNISQEALIDYMNEQR